MVDVRTVLAARDALLSDGKVPRRLRERVRPAVLQSWQRSIASGAAHAVAVRENDDRWQAHTALRRAADPVLGGLADRLAGLDTGVLIADHKAVVLRRWVPDTSIVELLDRVNSDVGYNFAEDSVGTNGVGTVAETGEATQISGPEHLSPTLSGFTCVGAPIRHPLTRRIEGVITLSCLSDVSNQLLTPLLSSTAREIEHRMLDLASARERVLLSAYLRAAKATRAAVAAVGRDLLLAGPQVTELLGNLDQALLWEYVSAVASSSRALDPAFDVVAADRLRIAKCELVHDDDGEAIGAIVEFEAPGRQRPRALATSRPIRPPEPARFALAAPGGGPALPGRSAQLVQTLAHAAQLAATEPSVLIAGEPGVGKRTLAEAMLAAADIDPARVVCLDAATATLDGAGAFLRALRAALGGDVDAVLVRHVETLDETGSAAAAALLERAIGEGRARLIVTHTRLRDGAEPVARQRLLDLIALGRVSLPPLRERPADIGDAACAMLAAHAGTSHAFSSPALRVLMRAPWPGNLRQLDSTVRGLVATATRREIGVDDLPAELRAHVQRRPLSPMETLELNAILDALQRHGGNKFAAAAEVGISRSTLYRKLRAYHVDPDRMYF